MEAHKKRWGQSYLTRIKLSPKIKGYRLMLHIFWEGDPDPDCHDHPWDFYTFPLVSYDEEVLERYPSFAGVWSYRRYTHSEIMALALSSGGLLSSRSVETQANNHVGVARPTSS